jgi:Transposase domain (DUF772)
MRHCVICSHDSTSRTPKLGAPIAPEKLLRALLLQARYSLRSERLLMEQLDYNHKIRVRVEERVLQTSPATTEHTPSSNWSDDTEIVFSSKWLNSHLVDYQSSSQ